LLTGGLMVSDCAQAQHNSAAAETFDAEGSISGSRSVEALAATGVGTVQRRPVSCSDGYLPFEVGGNGGVNGNARIQSNVNGDDDDNGDEGDGKDGDNEGGFDRVWDRILLG